MNNQNNEDRMYQIARLYLQIIIKNMHEIYLFDNPSLKVFTSAVEQAYSSLSIIHQKIINNDFFYQDYPGWWKDTYHKSKYLKMKNEAVNHFCEVFYAI